jgi:hypothetical protein
MEPDLLLPAQIEERKPPTVPDLSGFKPSEIAFITKGIGMQSRGWKRSAQNADSTVENSKGS